jgi:hypothetical protein
MLLLTVLNLALPRVVNSSIDPVSSEYSSQLIIHSTTELPDTNDLVGPYDISTHVMSPHGIAAVYLYHMKDEDSTFAVEEMQHTHDDVYSVSIEGHGRGGGLAEYFIHAVDSAFSVRRDPENAPLETYGYRVYYVPDFLPPDSVTGIESFYPGSNLNHQWEDFDSDGDLDLYMALPSQNEANRFYRNDGGRIFTDVADMSGVSLPGQMSTGAVFGDYNNDGYEDLAVLVALSHPVLFHNRGDGTFEDVSELAGFTVGLVSPIDLSWIDADVDGYVDLLIIAQDGLYLFMNEGGSFFVDEAELRGLPCDSRDYEGVLCFDADGDGDSEILLFGSGSSFFENGSGYFTDMSSPSGLGGTAAGGSVTDIDSDGDLDLILYNNGVELFENDGIGRFTNVSTEYGLSSLTGSKPSVGDINTDGLIDFGLQSGNIFVSEPDSAFIDVSSLNGIVQAISLVDINADGLVDLFTWLNRLWLGTGFSGGLVNGWLEVDLSGTVSNRSAVGAVAVLHAGESVSAGIVPGASPQPKRLYFGLEERVADSLVIRWPSGAVQVVRDLPVNTTIEVEEDSTIISIGEVGKTTGLPLSFSLHQNYPNPFNPVTTIYFEISGAVGEGQQVSLTVYDTRGRQVRRLMDEELLPGSCRIVWDGRDDRGAPVASGIYFYRLVSENGRAARKMVLVK